jgi:hypothetical protein
MPGVLDLPAFRRCYHIILVRPPPRLPFLAPARPRAETIQLPARTATWSAFGIPLTQDEDTITVQLPGKDTVLTYKWEAIFDQDWVKKNQARVSGPNAAC